MQVVAPCLKKEYPESSPSFILESIFSSNATQPGLTLVTGLKGAGKTRWCMDLVDQARVLQLNVCGLTSPAIFKDENKVGIDLLDLHTGQRRNLAYRAGYPGGDFLTKNWQINKETLDWGNAVLEGIDQCDLLIIDEIGPLEFEQGVGLTSGLEMLDSGKYFPAVVVVRPSLLAAARNRWPFSTTVTVQAQVEA